jgi:hypothetical protein
MPLLTADRVIVLPEQRDILERLVRTRSTSQQLALRARMILQVADGVGVRASARELGVWPKTVRYWCKRWRQAPEGQPVAERLADAARSGAPATFTAEQICAVVAMMHSPANGNVLRVTNRDIETAMRLVGSAKSRRVRTCLKKPPANAGQVLFRSPM